MKSFKEFLTESGTHGAPVISTDKQHVDLRETNTINELNRTLAQVVGGGFVNPYSALEKVRKIVCEYGLQIPQVGFIPEPKGNLIFEMQQFGHPVGWSRAFNHEVNGIQASGDLNGPGDTLGYKLHFSYEMQPEGFYTASAALMSDKPTSPVSQ